MQIMKMAPIVIEAESLLKSVICLYLWAQEEKDMGKEFLHCKENLQCRRLGSIPGSGRSPGKGIGYPLQ